VIELTSIKLWDKEKKIFVESGFYITPSEMIILEDNGPAPHPPIEYGYESGSRFVVLRSTEVKDTYNKIIFEGDILAIVDSVETPFRPEEPFVHVLPVIFHKGAFGVRVERETVNLYEEYCPLASIIDMGLCIEVIGNIYDEHVDFLVGEYDAISED